MDIEKDGRSTHCYCENPRALGFRNYHNRDTMGFTTSHLGISNTTMFLRMMIKKGRQILPSYGIKIATKLQNFTLKV